jgi:hypothetical protein
MMRTGMINPRDSRLALALFSARVRALLRWAASMPDAAVPIPAGPLQLSITLQLIGAVKVEPGSGIALLT